MLVEEMKTLAEKLKRRKRRTILDNDFGLIPEKNGITTRSHCTSICLACGYEYKNTQFTFK